MEEVEVEEQVTVRYLKAVEVEEQVTVRYLKAKIAELETKIAQVIEYG